MMSVLFLLKYIGNAYPTDNVQADGADGISISLN